MPKAAWISQNIELMKKDLRSARELRESQRFYDLMDHDQDLQNAKDITILLRHCFGIFLDPSIIFIKCNIDTETVYILRECKYKVLDRIDSTELEIYSPSMGEDLDFESYGDEKEFHTFISNNISRLTDICYSTDRASRRNPLSLSNNGSIENEIYDLSTEFICLLNLFGNNAKAYKWYYEKYHFQDLQNRWSNKEHAFFKVIKDMKLIANAYEPVIKDQLSNAVIKSLKSSPSFHINEDDAPQNGWELIGYLASTIGFESTLSDVENKVWKYFKTLEEEKQLLLHYYIFQYQSFDLKIDEKMTDITDLTYEDLQTYLRNIAREIASQAYSEWTNTHGL